jgi:hypothetical protein
MTYVADGIAERLRVKAKANFSDGASLTITGDEATAGNGPYVAPKAVKAGEAFFAEYAGMSKTSTVVVNGQELTGVTPSGTYVSNVKFTVSNGAITAIALS